jgi:hypothetical protein
MILKYFIYFDYTVRCVQMNPKPRVDLLYPVALPRVFRDTQSSSI